MCPATEGRGSRGMAFCHSYVFWCSVPTSFACFTYLSGSKSTSLWLLQGTASLTSHTCVHSLCATLSQRTTLKCAPTCFLISWLIEQLVQEVVPRNRYLKWFCGKHLAKGKWGTGSLCLEKVSQLWKLLPAETGDEMQVQGRVLGEQMATMLTNFGKDSDCREWYTRPSAENMREYTQGKR